MISLEMKYPQLSKPEATAARNQNSHRWQNGEKKGRNQAQSGGTVLLWLDEPAVCYNCSRVRLCIGLIWFPRSCPDGRLGDKVLTGDLVSGAHRCSGLRAISSQFDVLGEIPIVSPILLSPSPLPKKIYIYIYIFFLLLSDSFLSHSTCFS